MMKLMASCVALAVSMSLAGCGDRCGSMPEAATVRPSVFVAAATPPPPVPEAGAPVPDDLLHRRFVLASVDGRDVAVDEPAQRPDIEFNEGLQISGRVCNRFRGPAELRDGTLRAERLASTMMLCIKPELNELEKIFHAMLRAGADVALTGNGLILSQGGHTLVYEQADWVR